MHRARLVVRGDSPDLVAHVQRAHEAAGLIDRLHENARLLGETAGVLVDLQRSRARAPWWRLLARRRCRIEADRHARRLLILEAERVALARELSGGCSL